MTFHACWSPYSSTKAATVYLHAAKDRDRAIADATGEIVKQGLGAEDDDDDPPLIGTKINLSGTRVRNKPNKDQGPGRESSSDQGLLAWSG
ncbi:hypothetical protein GCM10023193_46120 [Planotetraspora kaengkrachanensis]|uniref:Uncharacterized protein n=1 Tax=Planotetraspora kaengkrachanensis TaxID=575193 RepID=A0A8J3Q068_9ACTN|nr:hypothetical protein Pka01_74420 [Planotetraspora kaengkrachanensis]